MLLINPVSDLQKLKIIDETSDCIQKINTIYKTRIKPIEISFDLKGRCSGMYTVRGRQRKIRYNPYIFSKYFNDGLATTIPHEVAHYASDIIYGIRNIKPHGVEWKSIMQSLGVEPRVTGDYDLAGIPVKRQQRFEYHCGCMSHKLTTTRHNKVINGRARYLCQKCKSPILFSG
jgi:SprT protein